MKIKRRILLVNRKVQLKLIGYALFSAVSSSLFTVSIQAILLSPARPEMRESLMPLLVFGGIGLLVMILICSWGLIISNQIAGPMVRLHRNLRAIADGVLPVRIDVRPGDAFSDLFDDYNRAVERLREKPNADTPE